jgi:hypothetical protein
MTDDRRATLEVWKERWRSGVARLAVLSDRRWFQLALAAGLACIHLLVIAKAGHDRLGDSFNSAPGEHVAYTNPRAPSLGPIPRQPHHWSRLIVSRFDAQHYIGTALRGLSACPTSRDQSYGGRAYLDCGLGWLPGFGWVGGAVVRVTGLEPDVALTLVSVLCAILINLMWICPTMISRLGRFEAFAVLLAWNCYPEAWGLVVPLTESLVCALSIGGFVMLAKERWFWAAALVGASTALRLPTVTLAFAMGCALLLAAWDRRRAGNPRWWTPLAALPLCGWGQLATMAVFQLELHNWRAFLDARFAFGDHNRLGRLIDVSYFVRGFGSQCADIVIYFGMIAIMLLTWRRVLPKFSRVERVFLVVGSLGTVVLVVAAAMEYWGMTRYMLLCPLAFVGMGVLARDHRGVFVMWLLLGLAFYWHLELCGYLSQGDPNVCPCMGRVELRMPWAS